ncbi:9071_t:CDS:2 [Entrophospora sp. SA101]|nr:9071_t:CDS:2 [Entrophospora sp. SA101]
MIKDDVNINKPKLNGGSNQDSILIKIRDFAFPIEDPRHWGQNMITSLDDNDYKKACALYDFLAENTSELSFKEGDILTINYQQCVGWLVAELDGKVGLIPENYVAISSSDGDDEEPIIELEQYNTIPHSSISHNILQLIQIMMQNLDKCSRYGWNCQNRE